jgi:hypothetical protein
MNNSTPLTISGTTGECLDATGTGASIPAPTFSRDPVVEAMLLQAQDEKLELLAELDETRDEAAQLRLENANLRQHNAVLAAVLHDYITKIAELTELAASRAKPTAPQVNAFFRKEIRL